MRTSLFRSAAAVVLSLLWIGTLACQSQAEPTAQLKPFTGKIVSRSEGPQPVGFDIKPTRAVTLPGTDVFDCVYSANGKIARFRLELKHGKMQGDIPMASGEGKFVAAPGSDNAALLQDLMKTLDAKHLPTGVARVPELPFDAVVLGEKQSRDADGGFATKPPGDWMLVKLFFPKGGDDGEVFLNLNQALGKAEFAFKDSEYGDYVLAQLAKVL